MDSQSENRCSGNWPNDNCKRSLGNQKELQYQLDISFPKHLSLFVIDPRYNAIVWWLMTKIKRLLMPWSEYLFPLWKPSMICRREGDVSRVPETDHPTSDILGCCWQKVLYASRLIQGSWVYHFFSGAGTSIPFAIVCEVLLGLVAPSSFILVC